MSRTSLFRAIGVFCLCLSLAAAVFADTIRLKDGSIIKGKIVSFGGGKFVVLIADGTRERQLSFSADEVEAIEFDSQAAMNPMVRTSTDKSYEKVPPKITKNGNETVITVGSRGQTDTQNQRNTAGTDNNNNPPARRTGTVKPIQINVKVLADTTANGWTNSGWVVKKGQKIRISATGRVSLGNGRYSSPAGIATLPDEGKLIKSEPTGGLIAVIGDDNNDFIYIGQTREFIAERDGALFLGVNEGNLEDNSGAFDATIEIDPTF